MSEEDWQDVCYRNEGTAHVSCSCVELSATTAPKEACCNRRCMFEEAQVLGVGHTLKPEWAACSHPGTNAVGNHLLVTEDHSKTSLPSSRDRRHRVTCPQTNQRPRIIGSTSWPILRFYKAAATGCVVI